MKFRSFLRYLDLRWFRGLKLRPTRPIQTRRVLPLHVELLETRTVPSTAPTILTTLTTPADGSTVNTASPTIQVVFSEQMNPTAAQNTNNYSLFGSAGNAIPINAVTLTGPDSSGHESATLTYNGGANLILDTYTLFVRADQLTSVSTLGGLPIAQPGQYVVANGGTHSVSVVNLPGTGTLGSLADYNLPSASTTTLAAPVAAAVGDLTGPGGLPALVVVDAANSQVDIFNGQSAANGGGFDLTPDLILNLPTASANKANSLVLGDFNNDGNLDIAVANAGANNISVFLNTTSSGNLSFGASTTYTDGGLLLAPGPIVAGDFLNNGNLDLAIANTGVDASDNYNLNFLVGDGTGNFTSSSVQIALGNSSASTGIVTPTALAVGQLDNNAKLPDLAAAGTGGLETLINASAGVNSFSFNPQALSSSAFADVAIGLVRAPTSPANAKQLDIVGIESTNKQLDIWQNDGSASVGSASFTAMIGSATFAGTPSGLTLAPLQSTDYTGIGGVTVVMNDIAVTENSTAGQVDVLLNNSTIGSTTFAPPVQYAVDNNPVAVVAGDFDGVTDPNNHNVDGLVSLNTKYGDFSLLEGAGDGTLQVASTTSLLPTTQAIAVGDLNNDGVPDLVIAQNTAGTGGFHGMAGSASITVMLGQLSNGVVTYGAPGTTLTYTKANSGLSVQSIVSIAIGDVTGDGFADIVVADQTDSKVDVLKNSLGAGETLAPNSFIPQGTISVGSTPTQLVLADFTNATYANGNPILDLAVAHQGGGGGGHGFGGGGQGGVSILIGNGNGTFGNATEFDRGNADVAIAVADFNHDGNLDFVVANSGSAGGFGMGPGPGTFTVYYGNGKGNFSNPNGNINPGISNPDYLAVGDLNGDGFADIIVASASTGATTGGLAVVLNQAGTGFGTPIITSVLPGTAIQSVVVANVNNDAFPDLIVTTQPGMGGSTTDNVYTLLGNGDGTFQRAVPYIAGGTTSPTVAPGYGALISDPFERVTTFHSGGTTVEPNLIVNGNFSATDLNGVKGNLTGWQQYELPDNSGGSNGSWSLQTGTTSPLSGVSVTPPSGTFQAMLDQANQIPYQGNNNPNAASTYSGSSALYQDVTIPSGTQSVSLSLTLSLYNMGSDTSSTNTQGWSDNTTPQILDYRTAAPNQQVRVDIMDPNNPNSISGTNNTNGLGIDAADGLLANIFMTTTGDVFTNPVKIVVSSNGTITVNGKVTGSVNLKQFAGQTVLLRIATTNNQGQLLVGVENVQFDVLFPDTTPPTIGGLALRDPGYTDPNTGTVNHTTDATLVGQVADIGGLNTPAGFKQGNIAYVEFDLSNDSFSGASGDVVSKITNWDPLGNFTFTVPNATPGLNTIDVAAVDSAGLVSAITPFTFYYQGPSLTDWQAYGPGPINVVGQPGVNYTTVSGDVTAVATDPTDPSGNTYYIGSDNGGVWKTTDGGQDYKPLTDYVTNATGSPIPVSVGALAVSRTVDPATNTHVVYVGTGVANNNLDSRTGFGVLMSTDGGTTWEVDGNSGTVLAGATISSIVIDNDNPNIVYVAVASGGASGPGVYKTTDALDFANATWTNMAVGNEMFINGTSLGAGAALFSVTDLVEDPFASNRLIMGIGNIGLTPGAVAASTGVWLSINSGQSWTLQTGGVGGIANSSLPSGQAGDSLGRVLIAMGTGRVGDEADVYVLIGTPPTSTTAPNFNYGSEYSGTSKSGLYFSPNNMLDFTNVMLDVNLGGNDTINPANFQPINLFGENAANAGSLIVDPNDPLVVYVGGSARGVANLTNQNQSFIRVDVGDIDGINGNPHTGQINTGDDLQKEDQAFNQAEFYYRNATGVYAIDAYKGEGVYWYNLAGDTSGKSSNLQLLPPDITSLAFDAQGRLIIGTDSGVWRGVSEGFGYDYTSGNTGILARGGGGMGGGGGSQFSAPGMTFTALNGNLQISDLTSVAIDPSTRGVYYTTQFNTGTAGSNGVLQWSSEGLTGPTVNGVNLGITNAGAVLIATPAPGAPADTPNTLYRVWEYANGLALVPELSNDNGATFNSVTGINPTGLTAGDFPAFVINPTDVLLSGIYESELLLGTLPLEFTSTSGNVFDAITPSPAINAGGTITALAIASSSQLTPAGQAANTNVFFVGTSQGQVFITTAKGADNWPESDTGLPVGAPVTSIVDDPNNYQIAYVTFGSGGGATNQHVYMTTNAGAGAGTIWTAIGTNNGLPNVSVNSLVEVPVTLNGVTTEDLYVATDVGVYLSINQGTTWTRVGVGMPNVPVVNLQFNAAFQTIAAATQGRGVYTLSTEMDGPHVTALANGSATTTISSLNVTFNEPINPNTFTPSTITLTGPGGASDTIAVLGVTNLDSGQDEEFQITFAPQTANGLYTISFGPNVQDQVGNAMDQNQNGINGEAADVFSGRVLFQAETNSAPVLNATAVTFPATNEDGVGGNNGTDLASWVAANVPITDADPGAVQGIAITGIDDTNGTWQYSQNSGTSWTAVPTTVSETNALLLQASSTNRLRFVPATNYIGTAAFTFRAWDLTAGLIAPTGADGGFGNASVNGGTSSISTAEATATIPVLFANHPPSFTAGPNETALENTGLVTVPGWATNLSAGPANESSQTLTFIVTNNNPGLFAVQPAISPNGTLTYQPALGANGSATITVTLMDNGGTANGGQNTSAPSTFVITITPVNQAPTFTGGPNQTPVVSSGLMTVPGFITNISAGAANEASQALTFEVSNSNPGLFVVQPTISANGTLTYQVGNTIGTATVTVILVDNGGTANGGHNTSATYTFTITAEPVVSSGSADAVWVSDLYREVLGREITAGEVSYWTGVLDGGASRLSVATQITSSPEYYIHYLQTLYMTYLGRKLDPSGQDAFLPQLESGVSPTEIKADILSSPEYYAKNGGTTFGYLFGLYRDVLGTQLDSVGQNYWSTLIANGESLSQVALGILTSPDGEARVVQGAYQLLLNRSANPADTAYWSGVPDGTLAADIAATPEYGLVSSSQFYNSQPDQNWLNQVYQDMLGQSIDAASLNQYITQIRSGVRRPDLVSSILSSPAYYSEVVTAAFTKILNRQPDAASVTYFVNILNSGASVEQVESMIYGSAEFFSVESGATDQGFLQALYPDALNRPLDSAGASYWEAFLAEIPSTQQVAFDVLTSTEADADVVTAAYLNLLRRPVDPSSLTYWVGMFQEGMTSSEFYSQLLGSPEYYTDFSK